MEGEENMRGLETLMNEFFSPLTGNERKREIEIMLSRFSEQNSSWRDSLFFLNHSSNHYVSMYCLTILEQVIQRRWFVMIATEKTEIRTNLHVLISNNNKGFPSFIRNKIMKLIVDIAKVDWPHFYPDFFPQIFRLINTQDSILDGLIMLLTACEELGTPREDISTSRACELKKLMNQQVSHISLTLTNILESVLDTPGSTTTPPPSPSLSGDSEDSNSMDGNMFTSTTTIHVGTLNKGSRLSPTRNLDPQSILISSTCLKCFSQIFCWADLHFAVNSRVINVLFQFSSLIMKNKRTEQGITELSVLAMEAVNEIMAKNYIPLDFQDYLLSVYRGTLVILQDIVSGVDGEGSMSFEEEFLDKITDFLKYFVSTHLKRCENNAQFPLLEFLSLMFKYSFQQPSIPGFSSCMEIWCTVVEYIQGSIELNKEEGRILVSRYQEALLSLVYQILRKLQFRYNAGQLEELNNIINPETNQETEWQTFLNLSVETIMKVAELYPIEVLRITDSVWKETSSVYMNLEKVIRPGSPVPRLELASIEDEQKLDLLLKDFCSLLQLVGRISVLFIGEMFLERLDTGMNYLKELLLLTAFSSQKKIYSCSCENSVIKEGFLKVHAETLAALKAWCHWLAALHSEALSDSKYTWVCSDLTSKIVSAVVVVIKDGGSDVLVHAASHFLVTLTGTVRPPSIWKLKEFTDLYSSISHLRLQPDAHRLLVRSLTNVLLLHWPGIQEQKWEDRKKHLTKFLRDTTEEFRNLRNDPNFSQSKQLQTQAEPIILHTLLILGDLVENVLNEVTQTKKLCHDSLREYIDLSLWLFPLYIHSPQLCEQMFKFFHTVFDVLKTQMGSSYVEQAVQTFLSLFGENHLSQAILSGEGSGSKVVEKFLSILTFIVSEPGPTFRKFVPSTLSLCLEHIYPLVATRETSDIRAPMYSLLYHTLLNNWQYFFKSTIAGRSLNSNVEEETNNSEVFLLTMRAFGQSFLQPDIAVFRQNLSSLEDLHLKWKLYQKPIFLEHLMAEFLTVFVQVLVSKSHNLLKEEISMSIFNMALVDFPAFFDKFLPHLLSGTEQLDENQRSILLQGFRRDVDLPSFIANLSRFITDLRFYQLINSSLPSGSITF